MWKGMENCEADTQKNIYINEKKNYNNQRKH